MSQRTPAALPGILDALQCDGYTIVPISELLIYRDYTIGYPFRQCAA